MAKKEPKNIETRPLVEDQAHNHTSETLANDQPQYRIKNKSAHYVCLDIPGFGSCYIPPFSLSVPEFYAGELAGTQIVIGVRSGELEIVKI